MSEKESSEPLAATENCRPFESREVRQGIPGVGTFIQVAMRLYARQCNRSGAGGQQGVPDTAWWYTLNASPLKAETHGSL